MHQYESEKVRGGKLSAKYSVDKLTTGGDTVVSHTLQDFNRVDATPESRPMASLREVLRRAVTVMAVSAT